MCVAVIVAPWLHRVLLCNCELLVECKLAGARRRRMTLGVLIARIARIPIVWAILRTNEIVGHAARRFGTNEETVSCLIQILPVDGS